MNNVLPKFTSEEWWLPESCTQISISDYDWVINTTATWEGPGCYVPTELLGKTITIGCSSISSNAGLYVQNSVTWDDIAVITSNNLEVTVTIPEDSQAVISFQVPEKTGQISITGAYIYVEGGDSGDVVSATLRPTSATGNSWSNVGNAYDNNTNTASTVSISSSNYSSRTLSLNFDTSVIPSNATIKSATLNVVAKQSSSNSSRRITVRGDINGDSSKRVISTALTSTANTTLTADVTSYINSLSSLLITGYMTSSQSQTFSIYEVYIDVKYEMAKEPVIITELSLNKTQLDMKTNSSTSLKCTITPAEADDYSMLWTKDNDRVELIPNELTCVVKALSEGNSLVTVTDAKTNLSASCIVVITKPIEQTKNAYLGSKKFINMSLGNIPILKMYVGDVLVFYNTNVKGQLTIGYTPVEEEDSTLDTNAVIVTNFQELDNAIYNLQSGQTIYLREGTYTGSEFWLDVDGTEAKPIKIRNYPNEKPVLSGISFNINPNLNYITIKGLTITNINTTGSDQWDNAIRVGAGCTNITIENNEFYNLTCQGGTNIESGIRAIYCVASTSESSNPSSNIIIKNNYVHDCMTGWSEAITLQGNITNCSVINNTIDNTGNIGIDIAGNYSWTGTVGDSNNQSRYIEIKQNLVMNCLSEYAICAGIYSDGARDLTIEHNIVYHCQCGIETGAEQTGATVENFYIRNNLLIDNGRSIGVGGYQQTSASHRNTYIFNNTVIGGTWHKSDMSMMSIYRTSNLVVKNNIFYAQSSNSLIENSNGTGLDFNYNCWYQEGLNSLPTNEGKNSIISDPLFLNNDLTINGDYTLQDNSPCINNGSYNDTYCGTLDLKGKTRLKGIIDMGCYEK